MRKLFFILIINLLVCTAFYQKKKEIKKLQIKSTTETVEVNGKLLLDSKTFQV